jgi:hypothetical protein
VSQNRKSQAIDSYNLGRRSSLRTLSPAGPVVARDDRGGLGRAAGPARPRMDCIQRKWAWARPSAAPLFSVRPLFGPSAGG